MDERRSGKSEKAEYSVQGERTNPFSVSCQRLASEVIQEQLSIIGQDARRARGALKRRCLSVI